MSINGRKISQLTVICLILFGIVAGCAQTPSRASKEERERVVSALDEMYKRYVSGSVMEARSNLVKAVTVMHENSGRIPELQTGLPMGYARLSLLERKAGFEAISRIYFEKSRYWRIIEFERSGQKPDEIISNHDSVSREDSDKAALDWDINYTKGVGPAYLKELR